MKIRAPLPHPPEPAAFKTPQAGFCEMEQLDGEGYRLPLLKL